jgi:conjugative relaxase-like TrwC/TraI family protein
VLSVAPLSQGPGYYLDLANINYYAEGGEPLPTWHGTMAKEFGLSGVASEQEVRRACAGYDPTSGEALVQNAGSEKRNPGHDLTFSAPKSVSVAWATADEAMRKAIQIQQDKAVRDALDFLEAKAGYARVGRNGEQVVKAPLLFALFEHGTSRAMDPQLHTHALGINLTMHADGRCTAIDSTHLYHWKMAAGAVYRASLAEGMQQLGFGVEQTRVGSSIGFELKHIPKDIMEEFSKRRAEIEEQLKLKAGSLDAASPKYAEMVAKETRRTKDAEKPRSELIEGWRETAATFGVTPAYLNAIREPRGRISPEVQAERKNSIFREAIQSLSEGQSHWNEAQITKAVAERAAGKLNAREIRDVIEEKKRGHELTHIGSLTTDTKSRNPNRYIDRTEPRFTTPEMLKLERGMLENAERIHRGVLSGSPAARVEDAIMMRKTMEPEQADAVRRLTSGPGLRLMTGIAGTGKTFTLSTCHDVWKAEGRDVIGCVIQAKTAKELERDTGIKSQTLDSLLWALDNGKRQLQPNSVVVLDEAGMVGTKHMARLMEHVAEVPGSRLTLVGDAKQLQAIAAGGPFKYLAEAYGEARLENIRRQQEKWARDAVKDLEAGRAGQAIQAFSDRGRFHLSESRPQAMARLIEQWKKDGGIQNPDKVLMLAPLNVEVKDLNLRAQAERIKAGEVDPDRKIHANGVFFHVGDQLVFRQNSKKELGVLNGEAGTVLSVDPLLKRLTVRHEDGRTIPVNLKRYSPENLQLAYASTTHRAQGATIEHVHVLMGGPLTDQHMGYVQASRSKISTHLFCDRDSAGENLRDLIRDLSQDRQKTLAQEVIDRTPEPAHGRAPRVEPERGHSIGF